MKSESIEINRERMCEDVRDMETYLSFVKEELEWIYLSIAELDAMWDNKVAEEYKRKLDSDYAKTQELLKDMDTLIDKMKYANASYNKCEEKIGKIIDAIQI